LQPKFSRKNAEVLFGQDYTEQSAFEALDFNNDGLVRLLFTFYVL
jgi:hypothetical protein